MWEPRLVLDFRSILASASVRLFIIFFLVRSFVIRVGLVTGIVTGIGATVNPYIEFYADNLPERRLGAFGIGLILCGFALQSLQYWLALFDVHLT